jgi:hypothetical protein
MKPHWLAPHLLLALGLVAAMAGASCSSKSPSEPSGGGTRSPIPPPPVTGFSVVVTANPGQLTTGSSSGSTINVRVVNTATGQPPPDATQLTLATTLGNFGSSTGPQQVVLQLVGGQGSAVLFPGASAGTATVTATLTCPAAFTPCSGNTGAASVRIAASGTFFVSSVTPNIGNPTGGEQVTINGGGFVSPVRVTFNGTPGQVVSVSPGAITVITPSAASAGVTVGVGQTASVPVGVTINVNQTNAASDTLANGFTYSLGGQPQQPQVFSVNPASGPDQGGTRVTILGQGFQAPVQVFFGSGTAGAFNGVEATVQSVTATQIVVLTPSATSFGQNNVDKVVDLLVKNVNSGFSTLAPQAFKYGSAVLFTSLQPDTTDWNKPIKVTIFGQGFQDPVAVDLGGIAAHILQTSGTEIQVLTSVPALTSCAGISAPSHEVNINTAQGATGPNFHYLITLPSISSIVPSKGPQGGGFPVTINGREFDFPNVSVTFGTATVFPLPGSNSSQLIVTAPAFTGTFPTQACPGPGGVTGTMNVPAAVDVKVTNTDTTCTVTATQAFTYVPNDQTCHATPPPPPVASFTVSQATGSCVAIFNDTSTGQIDTYSWSFGDTMTSAAKDPPPHDYSVGVTCPARTEVVTLTVTGPGGTSSVSHFVTVPGP